MIEISSEAVAYPAPFSPFDLMVDRDFIAAFPQVSVGYLSLRQNVWMIDEFFDKGTINQY